MSKASKEFLRFISEQDADERCALRDALTDILHICDEKGYDFNDLLKGAGEVFNEEDQPE